MVGCRIRDSLVVRRRRVGEAAAYSRRALYPRIFKPHIYTNKERVQSTTVRTGKCEIKKIKKTYHRRVLFTVQQLSYFSVRPGVCWRRFNCRFSCPFRFMLRVSTYGAHRSNEGSNRRRHDERSCTPHRAPRRKMSNGPVRAAVPRSH